MEKIIYIPIGVNCYIAHFLRSHNLREYAFPFDWNCASFDSVYNVLLNNFDGWLNEIFIGNKTKRMFFEDTIQNLVIHSEYIYPVICKKYNILFPHDYNNIDEKTLLEVKNKYIKKIDRFREIMSDKNNKIILIYHFEELNDWQKSVYSSYDMNLLNSWKFNYDYINKIKNLFLDKPNVQVISLTELSLKIIK